MGVTYQISEPCRISAREIVDRPLRDHSRDRQGGGIKLRKPALTPAQIDRARQLTGVGQRQYVIARSFRYRPRHPLHLEIDRVGADADALKCGQV
jgi:hypothetical protein